MFYDLIHCIQTRRQLWIQEKEYLPARRRAPQKIARWKKKKKKKKKTKKL